MLTDEPTAAVAELEIDAAAPAEDRRSVTRERRECIAPGRRRTVAHRAHNVPKGFETASIAPHRHAVEARSEAKATDAQAIEAPY
jgi:hypothetical protein